MKKEEKYYHLLKGKPDEEIVGKLRDDGVIVNHFVLWASKGNYPLKEYMWSNDVLKEIAKMLRRYHDSVSEFSIEETWQSIDNTPKHLR